MQKFGIFGKNLAIRDKSPRAVFTKFGVEEEVPCSQPRTNFHHRGFRNMDLIPLKS